MVFVKLKLDHLNPEEKDLLQKTCFN